MVLGILAVFSASFAPPCLRAKEAVSQTTKALPSRSDILSDLKRRNIVTPDAEDFTVEEADILARMKRAESLGAVDLVAQKDRNLKKLIFEVKQGESVRLHLTQLGFDRYLFLLSQKAIDYFESRGVKAKWAFTVKDSEGRNIFDPKGLLTPSGEDLYYRVLKKQPTEWKLLNGKVMSNHK